MPHYIIMLVTIIIVIIIIGLVTTLLYYKLYINSDYYRFIVWRSALKSAWYLFKNQLIADWRIVNELLRWNPWLTIIVYRLSIFVTLTIVAQTIIACAFLFSYFIYFIYHFIFKLRLLLVIDNQYIKLKYMTRAVIYDLFISVPRARAFFIFYMFLRFIWQNLVWVREKFKLGFPLKQIIIKQIGCLTKREHYLKQKQYTQTATTAIIAAMALLNFLLIKLSFILVVGVSYFSFITTCKLIFNAHIDHCFKEDKWPSFTYLYEHTIIHSIFTMTDSSYVDKFKITADLVQADNQGKVIYNKHFPEPIKEKDAVEIKPFFSDINNLPSKEDTEYVISKVFETYFGTNTLKKTNKPSKPVDVNLIKNDLIDVSKVDPSELTEDIYTNLVNYAEYLSSVKTEDFLVYSSDTVLQYRLEFNPGTKIFEILESINFFKLKNPIYTLQYMQTPDSKYIHPCISTVIHEQSSSATTTNQVIFTGLSTSPKLPIITLEKKLMLYQNRRMLPSTVNSLLQNKKQFLIPTAIADESLILRDPKFSNFIINKNLVSDLQDTIYRHNLLSFILGDRFSNYHLKYNSNINKTLLVLNNGSINNIFNKLMTNSLIFKQDVISLSNVILTLEKEKVLTKEGLTELKILSLIAITNKNDTIIISDSANSAIHIKQADLVNIYENSLQVENAAMIHEIFNDLFGTKLDQLEIKE